MRNTGMVKFENDLRKELLVPFSMQEEAPCPVHAKNKFISIVQTHFDRVLSDSFAT